MYVFDNFVWDSQYCVKINIFKNFNTFRNIKIVFTVKTKNYYHHAELYNILKIGVAVHRFQS